MFFKCITILNRILLKSSNPTKGEQVKYAQKVFYLHKSKKKDRLKILLTYGKVRGNSDSK